MKQVYKKVAATECEWVKKGGVHYIIQISLYLYVFLKFHIKSNTKKSP